MNAVAKIPLRHAVSAAEFLRMDAAGVFAPEARLELIDGEIIEMTPINSPHNGAVITLNRLLSERVRQHALLSVQGPLILDGGFSIPQPDLCLLKPRADHYTRSNPVASDAFLVIEVSDTTRDYDLTTKAVLHARGGVAELWVVDVNDRAIRVFREPGASGYGASFTARGEQRIACQLLPVAELTAQEAFPDSIGTG